MGQLRKKVKKLSARVREGDVQASGALLAHSVSLGHGKLALRRLFLANAMGVKDLEIDIQYFEGILAKLSKDVIHEMAEKAKSDACIYLKRGKEDV